MSTSPGLGQFSSSDVGIDGLHGARVQPAANALAMTAVEERTDRATFRQAALEWGRGLFRWRRQPGFGRLEAVVIVLYSIVVACTIPFHERWGDEVQAFLLARDNSFWNIFRHRLHYEGAPPLWHFLLRGFHLLGGEATGMNWFGAAFALAGVYVLLRWSPFPAIIRVMLPFTFFFDYQYAVVARSYVLFPLLMWGVCAFYTLRPRKPLAFVCVAGLLANVSLQGMVISTVLVALYAWQMWGDRFLIAPERWRQAKVAALLGVAMWGVAIYPAIPAPDVNFAVTDEVSNGPVHKLLVKTIGQDPGQQAPPRPFRALTKHYAPRLMEGPKPAWSDTARRVMWEAAYRPGGLRDIAHEALDNTISLLSQTTWPIANSNLLACLFLAAWMAWSWGRGHAETLLPWAGVLLVGTVLWVADHHTGMSLIALLGGVWIAAQQSFYRRGPRVIENGFLGLMAVVLGLQVAWSAASIYHDIHGSYDPGPETAQWLQENAAGETMAEFHFYGTSIQPWFEHNPFMNRPTTYWPWSWIADSDPWDLQTLAKKPRVVVYSWETAGTSPMRNQWLPQNPREAEPRDRILDDIEDRGYVVTHTFCGERFARFGSSFRVCDLILEQPADGERIAEVRR